MGVEGTLGGASVVRISGEIDYSNLDGFSKPVDEAAKVSPAGFIIDLSEATYLDSGGVAVIMSAYQRICPEGRLVLVVANDNIRDLLALIHPELLPNLFIREDLTSAEAVLKADD